ncbi:MAG TPA: L,D-transpeptidase [Telluria sp.]
MGHPIRANFKDEDASADALQVADWVLNSGNNRNLSFMVIDKKKARAFVFHPDGQLRGAAAVLLGEAVGDDSVPGIGERALSTILPQERTTPAGRFVAAIGRNLQGKDILWVDYGAAISLHRVVTGNPKERRAERLATPTPLDNRISYGCINVPVAFFNDIVSPAFGKGNGIVYILPETRPLQHVFAGLDAAEQARLQR